MDDQRSYSDDWCNCQERTTWHPHGDTSFCGPEPHDTSELTVNEHDGPTGDTNICGVYGPSTVDGNLICVKAPHNEKVKHRAHESWESTVGPGHMEWT